MPSPHHDHVPALGAQLFHVRRLVFGKHLRVVLVDAERARHGGALYPQWT
ncbi:MAG: hypothetical protein LIV29_07250 [Denitrobacterium sp.]|nr:hypothetical protein [Denitrobacterium sp.]